MAATSATRSGASAGGASSAGGGFTDRDWIPELSEASIRRNFQSRGARCNGTRPGSLVAMSGPPKKRACRIHLQVGGHGRRDVYLLPDHCRRRDGQHHPRGRPFAGVHGHQSGEPRPRPGGIARASLPDLAGARGPADALPHGVAADCGGHQAIDGDGLSQRVLRGRSGRRAGRAALPPAPDPGGGGRGVSASAATVGHADPVALGAGRDGGAHRPRRRNVIVFWIHFPAGFRRRLRHARAGVGCR